MLAMLMVFFSGILTNLNVIVFQVVIITSVIFNIIYLGYLFYSARMNLSHSLNKQIEDVHQRGYHVSFTKKELEELPTSKIKFLPYFMNFSIITFVLINFSMNNFIHILFPVISCILFKLVQHHVKPLSYILPRVHLDRKYSSSIFVGKIISNYPKKKYYLSFNDLKKHIFVCGLTGMGKSNFIRNFVKKINLNYKKIPFLLLEFKGEYQELAQLNKEIEILKPGINLTLNIFDPEDTDIQIYSENLLNLLVSCQIITFYEEYSAQMEKILSELLFNVISDVNRRNWEGFDYYTHEIIEKYKNVIPNVIQSVMGINNRLRRLKAGSLKTIFETQPKKTFQSIINSKIIIDLSNIIHLGGTKNDAVFFSNILFNKIWQKNLDRGKKETIQHFTIIEDSQFFISQKMTQNLSHTNYLEDFALLLRGTGECLITISTRPTISEDVMANAGIIVAFQQSYDQILTSKLLALKPDKLNYLTELKVGECLIKTNSISTPFVVKVPIISKNNRFIIFFDFLQGVLSHFNNIKLRSRKYLIKWFRLKSIFQETSKKISNIYEKTHKSLFKCKTNKGGRQLLKLNNNNLTNEKKELSKDTSRNITNIPTSQWVKHLRNAENLYLIEQYKFAYIECDNLFKNIQCVLKKKMQTKMSIEKTSTIDVLTLKSFSSNFQELFNSLDEIHNRNIDNINESLVERYLTLLKKLFLLIKVKKLPDNISNEKNEDSFKPVSSDDNSENTNEFLSERNPKNSDFIDSDHGVIPASLWKNLRNAVIHFEKS